jgi:hypothetical protein
MKPTLAFFSKLFILIICIILAFTVGYFFALRENSNIRGNTLTIKTNNGFMDNSLSAITFKEIYGLLDGNRKVYGSALIKEDGSKTEILIKIDNIPSFVQINGQNQALPSNYNLSLVRLCCNSLNYEMKEIPPSSIALSEKNNQLSGKYSTTFDFSFQAENLDRLLFVNPSPNNYKIVKDEIKDWPSQFIAGPAPYLWVNIK